jgi:hypothetical protein
LFTDQAEYLKKLSAEDAGKVMLAVFEYVETSALPSFDPLPDMVFSFIIGAIKRNKAKYDEICEKRREAARIRWDNKANANNANAYFGMHENSCIGLHYDSDSDPDPDSDSESESEREITQDGDKPPTLSKKKFTKPTVKEIQDYCSLRDNNIDPEQFYNFYESKGWLIGKTPMKDWKAAVNTWEKRSHDQSDASQNFGVRL